jgi:hypothetical protein
VAGASGMTMRGTRVAEVIAQRTRRDDHLERLTIT